MPTKVLSPSRQKVQSRNGRSYLLPLNLPAQPTNEDLNALEQYLSRISGSTETLHQGLAKAYLPILQNTNQPQTGLQDPVEQASHPAFAGFEFFERFRRLAHGQSPEKEQGRPNEVEGQSPSGTPFPVRDIRDHQSATKASLERGPSPLTPHPQTHQRQPSASRNFERHSIAPSQSLSQVALQRQQLAKQLGQPLISQSRERSPLIPEAGRGEDTQSKKEMALLDWARGVSAGIHPADGRGSQLGGTNVDNGAGSDTSSTTPVGGQDGRGFTVYQEDHSFEGYPRSEGRSSRSGPRQEPGYASDPTVQDTRNQTGYDTQHLYPGSYPFPPQPPSSAQRSRQSAPPTQFGWQSPVITERMPRDDEVSSMDRMTIGGTTVGGLTTAGGVPFSSMSRMRNALENEVRDRRRQEEAQDQRPTDRTDASPDISRLQSQVRTLQARIIAKHVSRSTLEKDVVDQTEQAREYRTELANAVRALKRAKEETRKLDEERKKGLRLYEETRERLVKYHEALKVTEARDAGREEGRLEAFHEIERWMTAPPIPIEPLGSLPLAVMRHMDNAQGQAAHGPGVHNENAGQPRRDTPQGPRAGGYAEGRSPEEAAQHYRPQPGFDRQSSGQGPQRAYPEDASIGRQADSNLHNQRRDRQADNGHSQFMPRPSPGQDPAFVPIRQTPPMQSGTPHNAADAYLDRVQHDPRLQGLLEGTPARSVPIASNTTGQAFTQPSNNNPPSHFRRHSSNPSNLDKPLPSPHQPQHRRYVSNGSQSQYAGSQMVGGLTSVRSGRHHNGLNSRNDGRQDRSVSQPDRYPPFPPQPARSILDHAVPVLSPNDQSYRIPPGYIDPRHVPLPDSRTISEFETSVQPTRQAGGPSFASQGGAPNRSRLAVGLRNEDDLSMIEERDERSTGAERSPRFTTQHLMGPQLLPSRGNVKAARSMQSLPSWKPKPKIVMPKRLGGPGTDIHELPALSEEQLRALHARREIGHDRGDSAQPYPYREVDPRALHPPRGMMAENEDMRGGTDMGHNMNNNHHADPAMIPLPPTRPGTVYAEMVERRLPPVSVIDFARALPLPDSRPGTVLSFDDRYPLKATVETILDREAPNHRLPGSILKRPSSADRSPIPGRRKTSTFVTVESRPR